MRMSQRESEAGSAFSQVAAANSAASSGMVMSAFSATFSKRNARCGSSLAWRRPPLGLGARLPRTRKFLHQVDDKGNRHPEMRRGRVARMTFIDKADNALTQIKRIRLRHRESPPFGSESYRLLKSSLRVRLSRLASKGSCRSA